MSVPAAPPVPAIPVDDALRLFLAVHFPHGLPPGVDEDELLARARCKVAADRPAWAAASAPADAPTPPPAAPGHWASADAEAVPGDPEEIYFFDRRQQARRNRARRREEARQAEAAEVLRRRPRASGVGLDAATLERARRIHGLLVEQVRAAFTLRHVATLAAPELPRPGLGGAVLAAPAADGPKLPAPQPSLAAAAAARQASPPLRLDDDGPRRRRNHD